MNWIHASIFTHAHICTPVIFITFSFKTTKKVKSFVQKKKERGWYGKCSAKIMSLDHNLRNERNPNDDYNDLEDFIKPCFIFSFSRINKVSSAYNNNWFISTVRVIKFKQHLKRASRSPTILPCNFLFGTCGEWHSNKPVEGNSQFVSELRHLFLWFHILKTMLQTCLDISMALHRPVCHDQVEV